MPLKSSPAERFFAKIEFTESCWIWRAARNKAGYGYFGFNGKNVYAHRWVYEFCVEPIPIGLTIDHLCRVTSCVHPAHLEAVPMRTNVLRGTGLTANNAAKTSCDNGHEFTPENTYHSYRRGRIRRHCRTCSREAGQRYLLRKH